MCGNGVDDRASEKSTFGEQRSLSTADDLVDHLEVDKVERLLQRRSEQLVRAAGFRYAWRMVVGQDHRRSGLPEGALHDLLRVLEILSCL